MYLCFFDEYLKSLFLDILLMNLVKFQGHLLNKIIGRKNKLHHIVQKIKETLTCKLQVRGKIKEPADGLCCALWDCFPVSDKNLYGLNWSASLPQLQLSICTKCTGTTNDAPAGIVTPVLSVKSWREKKHEARGRKKQLVQSSTVIKNFYVRDKAVTMSKSQVLYQ